VELENKKQMEFLVKTFAGLEEVLATEMRDLGLQNVTVLKRAVSFTGEFADMYRANFFLRTGLSVLWQLSSFEANNDQELYQHVYDFPWEDYMSLRNTFMVETTVNSSIFGHSLFVAQRTKDAIADRFQHKNSKRPSVDTENPTIIIHVHISENSCDISLNSSGEPLYKRGYRSASGDAPLNEVLAAGIILLTGWKGECDFIDPMCGSGTFLIEAALIAGNIAPGIFRKQYAFEIWNNFDEDIFSEVTVDEVDEKPIECQIIGYDILPKACGITRTNLRSASLYNRVIVEVRDVAELQPSSERGIVVTNPPYGERMYPANLEQIYNTLGSVLKHRFKGHQAWVISSNKQAMDAIGLKTTSKTVLYNGALECRLNQYDLYEGSKKHISE
jgi:putative N6-adenine-specific DNA methylase